VVEFAEHLSKESLQRYVQFSRQVQEASNEQISTAMQRYKCFMCLHKKYPDSILIPTLDIEMIWRSHCIRSIMYEVDCKANFGRILPHPVAESVSILEIRREALTSTIDLWKDNFGCDYIKDFILPSGTFSMRELLDRENWIEEVLMWNDPVGLTMEEKIDVRISLLEEDVSSDLVWFKDLDLRMQSDVLFKGLRFWESVLKSYERFLFISIIALKDESPTPTVFIDLVWRAHLIDPESYISDMKKIVGEVLDRKLEYGTDGEPCFLWEEQFGVLYQEEHEYVRHLQGETVFPVQFPRQARSTKRSRYPVASIVDRQRLPLQ
jgi:hypothetical protein